MSVESFSDQALLAVLVGQDTARRMFSRAGGDLRLVVKEAESPPYAVRGRNPLPPGPLEAALEFARRASRARAKESNFLSSPAAVKDLLRMEMRGLEHEEFYVVLLDAHHAVIDIVSLFRGSLTQTSVYPREVVKLALQRNAGAVVFAHNHPSGSPHPSAADEMLTRTLKEALALIEVRVLDHFIIAGHQVVSLAERGLV